MVGARVVDQGDVLVQDEGLQRRFRSVRAALGGPAVVGALRCVDSEQPDPDALSVVVQTGEGVAVTDRRDTQLLAACGVTGAAGAWLAAGEHDGEAGDRGD